jgi:hypothetical protein
MAEMEALKAKLEVYTKQRNKDSLDLSGMGICAEGAKTVASFLPNW